MVYEESKYDTLRVRYVSNGSLYLRILEVSAQSFKIHSLL